MLTPVRLQFRFDDVIGVEDANGVDKALCEEICVAAARRGGGVPTGFLQKL